MTGLSTPSLSMIYFAIAFVTISTFSKLKSCPTIALQPSVPNFIASALFVISSTFLYNVLINIYFTRETAHSKMIEINKEIKELLFWGLQDPIAKLQKTSL